MDLLSFIDDHVYVGTLAAATNEVWMESQSEP